VALLRKLLPKKSEFFALFSRHAALGVEGAGLLEALFSDLRKVEEQSRRIREVEHQADDVCQQTMELLHSSFITPIERGDIHDISSRLDDIMDHIEATAQKLWLYEIAEATPEAPEMSRLLLRATQAVKMTVDALSDLRDPNRIRALCSEVKAVEKENDRLLRRATARLFKEEQDPKTLIKWKEIYENIEDAVDRCEDVANVVEGVVLENA
jgi:uncharacterized protein Yka (UPF0111/DUF47 family)